MINMLICIYIYIYCVAEIKHVHGIGNNEKKGGERSRASVFSPLEGFHHFVVRLMAHKPHQFSSLSISMVFYT